DFGPGRWRLGRIQLPDHGLQGEHLLRRYGDAAHHYVDTVGSCVHGAGELVLHSRLKELAHEESSHSWSRGGDSVLDSLLRRPPTNDGAEHVPRERFYRGTGRSRRPGLRREVRYLSWRRSHGNGDGASPGRSKLPKGV